MKMTSQLPNSSTMTFTTMKMEQRKARRVGVNVRKRRRSVTRRENAKKKRLKIRKKLRRLRKTNKEDLKSKGASKENSIKNKIERNHPSSSLKNPSQ